MTTSSPEQRTFPGMLVVKEGFRGVSLEITVMVSVATQLFASSATTVIISLFLTVLSALEVVVEMVRDKFSDDES